ncbi:hypothetical protein P154DRAFT_561629 [Amniculicola lignicola CBS 123094]|uniref:Apple domain-containing protein n=1 Tax=Amniculicola lignicola CBS 123094 TaxID=1392246 RepID=A0A6A5WNR4_9PLEO|nr:hypothetical protein P154DRAFT_561629 [Amniculicola lignicola CBS 123094]
MKFFLTSVLVLLSTIGLAFADGGRGHHGKGNDHCRRDGRGRGRDCDHHPQHCPQGWGRDGKCSTSIKKSSTAKTSSTSTKSTSIRSTSTTSSSVFTSSSASSTVQSSSGTSSSTSSALPTCTVIPDCEAATTSLDPSCPSGTQRCQDGYLIRCKERPLNLAAYDSFISGTEAECLTRCNNDPRCASIYYEPTAGPPVCRLYDVLATETGFFISGGARTYYKICNNTSPSSTSSTVSPTASPTSSACPTVLNRGFEETGPSDPNANALPAPWTIISNSEGSAFGVEQQSPNSNSGEGSNHLVFRGALAPGRTEFTGHFAQDLPELPFGAELTCSAFAEAAMAAVSPYQMYPTVTSWLEISVGDAICLQSNRTLHRWSERGSYEGYDREDNFYVTSDDNWRGQPSYRLDVKLTMSAQVPATDGYLFFRLDWINVVLSRAQNGPVVNPYCVVPRAPSVPATTCQVDDPRYGCRYPHFCGGTSPTC